MVKDFVDLGVELLHVLLFRDLSFAKVWGIHALFTNHVDLLHDLLVVHLGLKLTHFLQLSLFRLVWVHEIVSMSFFHRRHQILRLDAVGIEKLIGCRAIRHLLLAALNLQQISFGSFHRVVGFLSGRILAGVFFALVEILMLLDVAHCLERFLPSLSFHIVPWLILFLNEFRLTGVIRLLLGRLPRVVLETLHFVVDLFFAAGLLLTRGDPEYAPLVFLLVTIFVRVLSRLTHRAVYIRPHDNSFLVENCVLFLQKLVDFVLPFITGFLMVQLHKVFLELPDSLLLLDLHSHVPLEFPAGL